jgi:hypothetical protein
MDKYRNIFIFCRLGNQLLLAEKFGYNTRNHDCAEPTTPNTFFKNGEKKFWTYNMVSSQQGTKMTGSTDDGSTFGYIIN